MYPERFIEVVKKEFKNIECIVTSPMNENELIHGRPKGGTAILYNSKINAKIEKNRYRMQPINSSNDKNRFYTYTTYNCIYAMG